MKLEFSRQIFEKYSNKNFMKIPTLVAELFQAGERTNRQTGVTELLVDFRSFVKAPEDH
jgi:hypothetical protein